MNLDFSPFIITGNDNNVYRGIKPSLIIKPFKKISFTCSNGIIIIPTVDNKKHNDTIIGYDGCFNIVLVITNQEHIINIKFTTLYNDGSNWISLYNKTSGQLISTGY